MNAYISTTKTPNTGDFHPNSTPKCASMSPQCSLAPTQCAVKAGLAHVKTALTLPKTARKTLKNRTTKPQYAIAEFTNTTNCQRPPKRRPLTVTYDFSPIG